MNRSDIVRELHMRQRTDLTRKEADWVVRNFFDIIGQGLEEDGRVELRGFGVFRVNLRQQAGFHNPKDGRYYGGLPVRTIKFYESSAVEDT